MNILGILEASQGRQPAFGFPPTILHQFPGQSLGNYNLVWADICTQQQPWLLSSVNWPSVCRFSQCQAHQWHLLSWTDIGPVSVLFLEFRGTGVEGSHLQSL